MSDGFVKKLPYGSNCLAELFNFSGLSVVVKQSISSIYSVTFSKMLIEDYISIKDKVYKAGTTVPVTYDIFLSRDYEHRLIIVESFMGDSLRKIFSTRKNKAYISKLVIEGRKLIKGLPEEVPLDTNPGNMAIDDFGTLSFIDFVPPDPWKYRNTKWEEYMIKAFPTVAESYDYPEKVDAYYSTTGRLRRFSLHVNKLLRNNRLEV